jgi:hypothetical protein
MADAFAAQTDGAGTKVHTWSRTVSANTVHDEQVLFGIKGLTSVQGPQVDVDNDNRLQLLPASGSGTLPYGSILVPSPYYFYLTSLTIRQADPTTTGGGITFWTLRLVSDGIGDCSWAGTDVHDKTGGLRRHDLGDPAGAEPGAAVQDNWGANLVTPKGCVDLGIVGQLTVPIGLTPITAANSDTYSPTRPVRCGPGTATKLLLILESTPTYTGGPSVVVNYEGYLGTD